MAAKTNGDPVENSEDTPNEPTLAEQLLCPVCQTEFTSPKLLPCLHTFCAGCLENSLRQSNIQNGQSFLCPLCRTESRVPLGGVEALRSNIFYETLQDFVDRKTHERKQVCDACETGAPAKRKCIECDDWLCTACCNMHRKVKVTRDHHIVESKDLQSGKADGLLKDSFEPLLCSNHNEPLKLYCTHPSCMAPICTVCKTTMGHDQHPAIRLEDQAAREKNVIIPQLNNLTKSTGAVGTKINNLKYDEKVTSHVRKKMHKAINTRLEEVAKKVMQQFGDYAETLHNEVEKLTREHRKDLQKELDDSKYKKQAMETANSFSQTLLEFDRAEELVFMAKDVKDCLKQYQNPPDTDPPNWRQPRLNPSDEIDPKALARYFGTLTFEGEKVRSVLLNSFNARVEGDNRPAAICDVAITDDNEIVVPDRDNKKLKVFSTKGVVKMSVGSNHLRQPNRATTMKSSGMVLVKDEKRLHLIYADGSYCGTFAEMLKQPVGLAQTKDGEVLITDWMSGAVHGFSEKGDHMRSFQCACEAPGYICSSPRNGNIIISDWKQNCIKVFNSTGKFLFQYGSQGDGPGQLNHPYGICSDKYGHILVADTWNNRIQMLSEDGKFLSFIVTREDGIEWPQSVDIDKKGNLVIVEQHGSVKVYQYLA